MLVDGYVRVSQVGDREGARFISPRLQRQRIEQWAKLHRATVVVVHEELNESGARNDRPKLLEALGRIERGDTDGLVVARMDRFGRSLLDSLAAIERIDRAGGIFVSVDDGLDLQTDTGRLVLRLMLSLAEWELDRIRSNWRDTKRLAVARGVHMGGYPPTGYRRGTDGRLIVDHRLAPWIREMFQRRADGATIDHICRWLEASGVRTATGNVGWARPTVYTMLRNRVYLGEARGGDFVQRAAHPALIDLGIWHRAQAPTRVVPASGSRRDELLTGVLRCAGCRCRVQTSVQPDGRIVYVCRPHHAAGTCRSPAQCTAAPLEEHIESQIERHLRRWRSTATARRAVNGTERLLADAEEALERYRDNSAVERVLGAQRYAKGMAARMQAIERAALAVAAAHERFEAPCLRADDWRLQSRAEKRLRIPEIIDCVFLAAGRVPVADRVFICWRGEAPEDLPRRGRTKSSIRPFAPAECRGSAATRSRAIAFNPWNPNVLETHLRDLVGDRRVFPDKQWFEAAGELDAYVQVQVQGGRTQWANRIGLPLTQPVRTRRRWAAGELEIELSRFIGARRVMPRHREFIKTGNQHLWTAMRNRGGVVAWSNSLGIEPPEGSRYRRIENS